MFGASLPTISYVCIMFGWIVYELEFFWWLLVARSSFVGKTLKIVLAIFDKWELSYAILDLDRWLVCGFMSKVA